MAITAPPPHASVHPPTPERDRRAGSAERRLGRRRTLPGGRAVVGGLLVTLAAIGTFVASTSASAGPKASVVVATRPIAIGERLSSSDLHAVPADLPDDVQATLYSSAPELEGAVALAPLDAGQAIARTTVRLAASDDSHPTHDLSFALERDRALAGRIQAGEAVDLVATYGTGADATTQIAVRGVRVVALDSGAGSSGTASAKVTITLAFDTEDDVLAAANALEVAKVTISRSAGGAPPAEGAEGPPPPTGTEVPDAADDSRTDGSERGDDPSSAPGSTAPNQGAP